MTTYYASLGVQARRCLNEYYQTRNFLVVVQGDMHTMSWSKCYYWLLFSLWEILRRPAETSTAECEGTVQYSNFKPYAHRESTDISKEMKFVLRISWKGFGGQCMMLRTELTVMTSSHCMRSCVLGIQEAKSNTCNGSSVNYTLAWYKLAELSPSHWHADWGLGGWHIQLSTDHKFVERNEADAPS